MVRRGPEGGQSRVRDRGGRKDEHPGQLRCSRRRLATDCHRRRRHHWPRRQVRKLHDRRSLRDRDERGHTAGSRDRGGITGCRKRRGPRGNESAPGKPCSWSSRPGEKEPGRIILPVRRPERYALRRSVAGIPGTGDRRDRERRRAGDRLRALSRPGPGE